MKQYIRIGLRVTKEQKSILEAKARAEGYTKLAFYLRSVLFRSFSSEDKIDAIYKKICEEP